MMLAGLLTKQVAAPIALAVGVFGILGTGWFWLKSEQLESQITAISRNLATAEHQVVVQDSIIVAMNTRINDVLRESEAASNRARAEIEEARARLEHVEIEGAAIIARAREAEGRDQCELIFELDGLLLDSLR